jgi:hypothetical protein
MHAALAVFDDHGIVGFPEDAGKKNLAGIPEALGHVNRMRKA